MANVEKDLKGLKCPQPTLELNKLFITKQVNPGDIAIITADCPTFEADVKKLCTTMKKQILKFEDLGGGVKKATIKV